MIKFNYKHLTLLAVVAVFLVCSCQGAQQEKKAILVFSKTEKFRHESIEAGINTLENIASDLGYKMVSSEDANYFTEDSLALFDAVVFLNTTGNVLNADQQSSFENFIRGGGGYFGIHAAADTEYDWPWYGKLVGGYFNGHPGNPNVREGVLRKTDVSHSITEAMPKEWKRDDEWYNYKEMNPDVSVLLKVDESSYEGGTMGENHPITWFHEYDGGRAVYTGLGHTVEGFREGLFLTLIKSSLQYATGDKGK